MADETTIWIIGEARDRELRFCLRNLESLAQRSRADIRHFGSVASLPTPDPKRSSADILVVLQDWARQYSPTAVHSLIAHSMPTGRLLCVYGTWCESEGRNSPDLWPHAVRVAARNARERFERELLAVEANEPTLPLTAGRDERFEHNHTMAPEPAPRGTVRVISSDRRLRETLTVRLAANGMRPLREEPVNVTIAAPDPGTTIADAIEVRTMPNGDSHSVVPMLTTDRQLLATISAT